MHEVILFLIFFFVIFSIGRKILRLFKAELNQLEEFLVSIALGAGFLMYFTIFLGTFSLLYKEVYILLVVVVSVLFFKDMAYLVKLACLLLRNIRTRLRLNMAGMLLVAYLFFIIINLVPVFSPMSDFDSMAYHLAFAKVYANNHYLIYQPDQLYTTMPQAMTMLYTIAELFAEPNLSAIIAYSFGVFASLAIYSLVRKHYSESAALIASLLFFTSPVIIQNLPLTGVDISLTYFFLAAMIIFFKYVDEKQENKRTSLLVLFSILLGIAISVKLTAIFAAAAVFTGILLSWLMYKRKFNIKHLIIFGFIALLFISPWLARGYVYTGNPLYPQAYTVFGGKYLDSSLTQLYANYHDSIGLKRNLINTLLVPWNITFNSKAFDTLIGITPFFIMVLPLIVFFHRNIDMKKWSIMFVISAAILIMVFLVHPVMRYLFPGLALLSILTAIIIDAMMKQKLLKVAIFLLLAASLVFNASIWYGINAKNVDYLLSGESEPQYYDKINPLDRNAYGAAAWINANTTADSVIMLFNEPRGYFLDRNYIVSTPSQTYIDYVSMRTTAELARRLDELNVDYILINDEFFDTYSVTLNGSEHVNALLRGLIEERGNLVYEKNQIRVYRI